jgi:hypothetical protein
MFLDACCLMHVARRLLHAICCMLHVARCTVWRKACRAEHQLRPLLVCRASNLAAVLAHSLNCADDLSAANGRASERRRLPVARLNPPPARASIGACCCVPCRSRTRPACTRCSRAAAAARTRGLAAPARKRTRMRMRREAAWSAADALGDRCEQLRALTSVRPLSRRASLPASQWLRKPTACMRPTH